MKVEIGREGGDWRTDKRRNEMRKKLKDITILWMNNDTFEGRIAKAGDVNMASLKRSTFGPSISGPPHWSICGRVGGTKNC